jgi:hypothetical protein
MLAIRRMTPTAFGTLMAIEPAVAVLLGVLILHQTPSSTQASGILIVVLAAAAAQRSTYQPSATKQPPEPFNSRTDPGAELPAGSTESAYCSLVAGTVSAESLPQIIPGLYSHPVGAVAHPGEVLVSGRVGGYDFSLSCVGRGRDDQVMGSAWPTLVANGNEQLGVRGSNGSVVVDDRNDGADVVNELLTTRTVGVVGKQDADQ